jgi:hypothetical protein
MASSKLSEGDTVGLTGEVTMVHDDGSVTVRLHGYGVPVTIGAEQPFVDSETQAGWTAKAVRQAD